MEQSFRLVIMRDEHWDEGCFASIITELEMLGREEI